ncbi:MAG: hypothetical protein RR162_00220 [Oscillospiraceae bacterium]
MPRNNDEKPWERQKSESSQAFEAFSTYRDLAAERSISKVCQKVGKSRGLIQRWSSQWNWVERARIYDNSLEKEARAKAVKGIKDMTDRHIRLSMQLQAKAVAALGELSAEEMSAKDIKEFIKMATELERLNRITEEKLLQSSLENNSAGNTSLADTIISAYEKRKEGEE